MFFPLIMWQAESCLGCSLPVIYLKADRLPRRKQANASDEPWKKTPVVALSPRLHQDVKSILKRERNPEDSNFCDDEKR